MSVATSMAPSRAADTVIASLEAARVAGDGMAPPAAILWTDGDGQWAEFVTRLRAELPSLFGLGAYDPAQRTGPAIWLRCVVDRTLPEVWPKGATTPILYLPRVERQQLRAGGDCPPELQPLVELQYRGAVWHQRNGRDWTIEAFLTSADGCGLELAKDQSTRAALMRVLPRLADVPLDSLRGRRLTAEELDKLAVPDPQRDLLIWMHDPAAFRAGHSDAEWTAFRNLVRAGYGLDPEDDGPSLGARKLLEGEGQWGPLWHRFCEAPTRYRGIGKLLREPLAGQGILVDRSRLPIENDEAEGRLRSALAKVGSLPHAEACERVLALEAEHGVRRGWVWRQLDESPLAEALQPLARLADHARTGLAGTAVEEVAASYAGGGWTCDEAALAALSTARAPTLHDLIAGVVRALYLPWLDRVSREFQGAVARSGGAVPAAPTATPEPGTCLVFADGLRFDLAARLQARLEGSGAAARLTHRIGPVPTVTATAKPLATVAVDLIEGAGAAEFTPQFRDTRQPVIAARLRERLAARGVDLIEADVVRAPSSEHATGWVEVGRIDEFGHKLGEELAGQVDQELSRVQALVTTLLEAGWRRVRVVTDHGWLLMPGGLPKVDLPKYLVASRWARCAMVREAATPTVTTYPWHWNSSVRIATPPGAGAYAAGISYAHGGVSPQECVVPELTVERGAASVSARITEIEWKRLRCLVTVSSSDPTVRVDVRRQWKQPSTSLVVATKPAGDTGVVSLAVRDECERQEVVVVLLDATGQVLDKRSTMAGGD